LRIVVHASLPKYGGIESWRPTSTLAQSSKVAPPARRERASSSSGLMPSFAGPSAARLLRRAVLMSVGVTCLVTES
jgi:hypothetical protein